MKLIGPNGGSIINISSITSAKCPWGGPACTARQKAAVDAITRYRSRRRLGPKKIRVNSLNPGMVETEGLHTAGMVKKATSARCLNPARRSAATRNRWTSRALPCFMHPMMLAG